jgi:hypothetical protein
MSITRNGESFGPLPYDFVSLPVQLAAQVLSGLFGGFFLNDSSSIECPRVHARTSFVEGMLTETPFCTSGVHASTMQ